MEIVKELYLQGVSYREITEKTGLKRGKIEYIVLKQLGLPRRRFETFISPENIQKVLRLVHWGYEPEEISEDENIPLQEVRKIIRSYGSKDISEQAERP